VSDFHIEVICHVDPPKDKPWMRPKPETVWVGIVPWIPRMGDTVAWNDCGYDRAVKYVCYDLDNRKVTVELEP
jgi:hypothetical protein